MSDDDEITGVHELPHPVRVVMVSVTERLRRAGERHDNLATEVHEMKPKVEEMVSSIKAVKMLSYIIVFLVTVLGAIGGGHLAMMHH